jgi:DNA replication and repair protein RecF
VHLLSLNAKNLRVLRSVELSFDAELIVFSGPNGSGKSSLLEAIHLLGTGRSFRARSVQDVISTNEESLLVRAHFSDTVGRQSTLAIEKSRRGVARFRLGTEAVKTASVLARQLPLVFVSADSQRLLSDGSDQRRKQLDWLMFHVEPTYQHVFSRYKRALSQRNAMLRAKSVANKDERLAWSMEMAGAGEDLHRLREERLKIARPVLESAFKELSNLEIQFLYKPGWDTAESLAVLLDKGWDADRARGFSAMGPHRADLQFKVGGRQAQHVVSRGEGKVLVFAILIAFAQVLFSSTQIRPLMLVDELASELDDIHRERFLAALRASGMQVFITTVNSALVNTIGWQRVNMFELSRGEARQVLH